MSHHKNTTSPHNSPRRKTAAELMEPVVAAMASLNCQQQEDSARAACPIANRIIARHIFPLFHWGAAGGVPDFSTFSAYDHRKCEAARWILRIRKQRVQFQRTGRHFSATAARMLTRTAACRRAAVRHLALQNTPRVIAHTPPHATSLAAE